MEGSTTAGSPGYRGSFPRERGFTPARNAPADPGGPPSRAPGPPDPARPTSDREPGDAGGIAPPPACPRADPPVARGDRQNRRRDPPIPHAHRVKDGGGHPLPGKEACSSGGGAWEMAQRSCGSRAAVTALAAPMLRSQFAVAPSLEILFPDPPARDGRGRPRPSLAGRALTEADEPVVEVLTFRTTRRSASCTMSAARASSPRVRMTA